MVGSVHRRTDDHGLVVVRVDLGRLGDVVLDDPKPGSVKGVGDAAGDLRGLAVVGGVGDEDVGHGRFPFRMHFDCALPMLAAELGPGIRVNYGRPRGPAG
jgi:hypothetical protein